MKITPIIGLEVHVELKTNSKMFCGCDASHFLVEPNTHTCPVCLGLPGALPVPNKLACEWCVKLGLALNCTVNKQSFFERKNYFYPDLAKGYQISQLQKPFSIKGFVEIDGHRVGINRVHMEEDTGKSQHTVLDGEEVTLLDFNRSGVPLVEIVSEPDIASPEEAKKYLNKIQQIVRYLGVSDADIEKGSMRCEPTVNLEIEEGGKKYYTPLAEIKNVASLTGVMKALEYEINRQTEEFETSRTEKNSTNKTTRGWDAEKMRTFLQREKEGSADYRYFPEPDIPPIEWSEEEIEKIKVSIPELPDEKVSKYKALKLSDYDAELISESADVAEYFEGVVASVPAGVDKFEFAKGVANLINGSIRTYLNEKQVAIGAIKLAGENLGKTVEAVMNGEISWGTAKENVLESCETGEDILEMARRKGQIQVSDSGEIGRIASEVVGNNSKAVEDYRKNPMAIGFLVGQVMKKSGGSANPAVARAELEKILNQ